MSVSLARNPIWSLASSSAVHAANTSVKIAGHTATVRSAKAGFAKLAATWSNVSAATARSAKHV